MKEKSKYHNLEHSIVKRAVQLYKQEGPKRLVRGGFWFIRNLLWKIIKRPLAKYYQLFKKGTFVFREKEYGYFYHHYNTTWSNERAIEVPIVFEILKDYEGKKILEVGNVLSHYFEVNHDIVDKYEKSPGVINEDVVNFSPSKKYDLILSISTLEHVGWDEIPKEPNKVFSSIEKLKNLLSPGGKLIVSIPLGYNKVLDRALENNEIEFAEEHYFERISSNNRWKEIKKPNIRNAKKDYPYSGINNLLIGSISPYK